MTEKSFNSGPCAQPEDGLEPTAHCPGGIHHDYAKHHSAIVQTALLICTIIVFVLRNNFAVMKTSWPYQKLTNQPAFARYIDGIDDFYLRDSAAPRVTIIQAGRVEFVDNTKKQLFSTLNEIKDKKQVRWVHYEEAEYFFQGAEIDKSLKQLKNMFTSIVGITVCWQTSHSFNQFWEANTRQNILEEFKSQGFEYDEILSLNLRSPSAKIIMVWRLKAGDITVPPKSTIAMHTVLRMQENLAYLREWIGYHKMLGASKFFLYHSDGSVGFRRATSNSTKYGVGLDCFGYDRERIRTEFDELWEDYKQNIIFVPWQPLDSEGEVIFGQVKSVEHYSYFYDDASEYTVFIDVDEFLFSPDNRKVEDILKEGRRNGVTSTRIMQAKFGNRFCYDKKRVTDIYEFFEADTTTWATKSIVVTDQAISGPAIHSIQFVNGREQLLPKHTLRFNHYNMFKGMISYALKRKLSKSRVVESDESMKRYKSEIERVCSGKKCSEDFMFKCSREQFKCPKLGPIPKI